MAWIYYIPVLTVIALALPPALLEKSWRRFFIACILSMVGVVVPLFFFVVSYLLVPDSKSDCAHDWIACFIEGKLALIPLALVATAALYAREIYRVKNRTASWIVIGYILGATISTICFGFALVFCSYASVFLLVPFYVAIWYSLRTFQLTKEVRDVGWFWFWTLAGSVPFWLASGWCSWKIYNDLPESTSNCFVVTAASRGHTKIVGPFREITRDGRLLCANQQLIVFWQLEGIWLKKSPLTHAGFRKIYNRVGPIVAHQITARWQADVVCVALKPIEWTTRAILKWQ